jgi:hypothetical protein
MLCVTLHVAVQKVQNDHGFFSSVDKTHEKQKIHMTEIVHTGSDHVTAQ